jgi:hypothetical protein
MTGNNRATIRAQMAAVGIKHRELAELLGCTRQEFSRLLNEAGHVPDGFCERSIAAIRSIVSERHETEQRSMIRRHALEMEALGIRITSVRED